MALDKAEFFFCCKHIKNRKIIAGTISLCGGLELHKNTVRRSLTMLSNAWRRHQFLTNQRPRNYFKQIHRQTENQHTVRPCSTSSACKNSSEVILYSKRTGRYSLSPGMNKIDVAFNPLWHYVSE